MAAESTAGRAADGFVRMFRWAGRRRRGQLVEAVGGPARARVILLFACVLALNSADTATIGAVAPQLEHALHIGNAKIGLLSSVTLLVGAVFVLPVGMLVDRDKRIPMLSISIVLWSIASLLSAFAGSYSTLLLTRLLLGAVTATAGPAIASLTGDYFPSRERGRIYAYILGGEIAGHGRSASRSAAASASLISWRAAFVLLAIPGFFLARDALAHRARAAARRPEPARAGRDVSSTCHAGGRGRRRRAALAEGRRRVRADAEDLAHEAVRRARRRARPAPRAARGPAPDADRCRRFATS